MELFLTCVLLPTGLAGLGGSRPLLQRLLFGLSLGWPGLWLCWMPRQPVLCPRDSFSTDWERWRYQAWLQGYRFWEDGCLWLGLLAALGLEGVAALARDVPTCPMLLRLVAPGALPSIVGVLVLGRDLPWRRLACQVAGPGEEERRLEFWQRWLPVAVTLGPACLGFWLLRGLIGRFS